MASKIYIENIGYLDCTDTIPIPLNFSLAQVQDVSGRNSAFSKTIVLPNTKNNQDLLGHIFEINMHYTDCDFNINRKAKCTIYQDETPVLENGYLQLKNIIKRSPSDISQDEIIEYEVVVFQNQTNLFTTLGNANVTDIDFSDMNHILNFSAVTSTSAHTYSDKYKYIWHYVYNDIYRVKDFRPAVYAKEIVDRIFYENDFSYTEDSFFNTDVFKRLLIPNNAKDMYISDEEKESREFRVSMNSGTSIYYTALTTSNAIGYTNQTSITPTSFSLPVNSASTPVMLWSDETTGVNYDGDKNNWNHSGFCWNVKATGQYNVDIKYNGAIQMMFPQNTLLITGATGNDRPFIYLKTTLLNASTLSVIGENTIEVPFQENYYGITVYDSINNPTLYFSGFSAGTYTVPFQVNVQDYIVDLNLNDSIYVLYSAYLPPYLLIDVNDAFVPVTLTFSANTAYSTINNYLNVTAVKNNINEGDLINFNQVVPQNVKQKDLLKSFFDAFNLYVEQDKDNENLFKIKPRNEYYADYEGQTLDWTNKLDYSQEYTTTLLSNLQDKRINFKYKTGEDLLNKRYLDETKYEYGQYILNFDNDFLIDEKKIELIFEPTPLVRNNVYYSAGTDNTTFIVPYILPNKESKLKLLLDGYNLDTDETYPVEHLDISGNTTLTYLNWYNYAGHFDNPVEPDIDLNWTTNRYYFYNDDDADVTDNNLFNQYWYNYIQLITESKMLTAYFNLNEYDILNLNFAKRIWIKDSYWILNKVIDYDASTRRLTKVELIKDISAPVFNKRRSTQKPLLTGVQISKPFYNGAVQIGEGSNIINWGNAVDAVGSNITIQRGNANGSVIGSGITTGQFNERFLITGNDVRIGSSNFGLNVIGDSNRIGSMNENLFVVGSNNNISGITRNVSLDNSRSVTITGEVQNVVATNVSGITINESNLVYLGNNTTVRYSGLTTNSIDATTYYSGRTALDAILIGMITGRTQNYLPLTGGSVTGNVIFFSAITANIIEGSTGTGKQINFVDYGSLLLSNAYNSTLDEYNYFALYNNRNIDLIGKSQNGTITIKQFNTGDTQSSYFALTNNQLHSYSSGLTYFATAVTYSTDKGGTDSFLTIKNFHQTTDFVRINGNGSTYLSNNLSAATYYSGATPLETIIVSLASGTGSTPTYVGNGLNTYTGGTTSNPTVNVSAATLSYLSAATISGATYFSGSTPLETIISNISAGATSPFVTSGSGVYWSGSTGNYAHFGDTVFLSASTGEYRLFENNGTATGQITFYNHNSANQRAKIWNLGNDLYLDSANSTVVIGNNYYSILTLGGTFNHTTRAAGGTIWGKSNSFAYGSAQRNAFEVHDPAATSNTVIFGVRNTGDTGFLFAVLGSGNTYNTGNFTATTYYSGSTSLETIISNLAGGLTGNYLSAVSTTTITVASSAPTAPLLNDLWVDSN